MTAVTMGRDRAADAPFPTIGHFLLAVRAAATAPAPDARLRTLGVSDEAGFAIPPAPLDSILADVVADSPILSRVTRRTITVGSTYEGLLPDDASEADGARFGGLTLPLVPDGTEYAYTWPRFRRVRLELRKYGCLVPASTELVEDAAAYGADIALLAREELARMMARLVWTGLGGAQPIGVATAASTIPVAIEGGQTIANTATHITRNAAKLLARLRRPERAAFFMHPDLLADVLAATTGGTADVRATAPSVPDAVATLHGRPLFVNHAAPAVGSVGDLACVDLARYLLATKGDMRQAMSVHARFLADEHLFRFSLRMSGAPFLSQPVTPTTGAVTKSDAAVLAARS